LNPLDIIIEDKNIIENPNIIIIEVKLCTGFINKWFAFADNNKNPIGYIKNNNIIVEFQLNGIFLIIFLLLSDEFDGLILLLLNDLQQTQQHPINNNIMNINESIIVAITPFQSRLITSSIYSLSSY